jgi:hypothetical protein
LVPTRRYESLLASIWIRGWSLTNDVRQGLVIGVLIEATQELKSLLLTRLEALRLNGTFYPGWGMRVRNTSKQVEFKSIDRPGTDLLIRFKGKIDLVEVNKDLDAGPSGLEVKVVSRLLSCLQTSFRRSPRHRGRYPTL